MTGPAERSCKTPSTRNRNVFCTWRTVVVWTADRRWRHSTGTRFKIWLSCEYWNEPCDVKTCPKTFCCCHTKKKVWYDTEDSFWKVDVIQFKSRCFIKRKMGRWPTRPSVDIIILAFRQVLTWWTSNCFSPSFHSCILTSDDLTNHAGQISTYKRQNVNVMTPCLPHKVGTSRAPPSILLSLFILNIKWLFTSF